MLDTTAPTNGRIMIRGERNGVAHWRIHMPNDDWTVQPSNNLPLWQDAGNRHQRNSRFLSTAFSRARRRRILPSRTWRVPAALSVCMRSSVRPVSTWGASRLRRPTAQLHSDQSSTAGGNVYLNAGGVNVLGSQSRHCGCGLLRCLQAGRRHVAGHRPTRASRPCSANMMAGWPRCVRCSRCDISYKGNEKNGAGRQEFVAAPVRQKAGIRRPGGAGRRAGHAGNGEAGAGIDR